MSASAMNLTKRLLSGAAIATVALVLAACSDEKKETASTAPTEASETAANPATDAITTASTAAAPASTEAKPAAGTEVA